MKINKKYHNIIFSCIAAIFISVPMGFCMVVINLGFAPGFFLAFLKSALVGTVISIPLANIGMPIAKKIADKITGTK